MSTRNERRLIKKKIAKSMGQRACGDCTACCTSHSVVEIDKPAGEPCSHLKVEGKGCSIYATRPSGCREWNCLWRMGAFGNMDRPDVSGVVFDVTEKRPDLWPDGQVLVAREAFPGGLDRAAVLLASIATDRVIVLVHGDQRNVVGPPDKVAMVQERLRRFLPLAPH